MVITEHNGMDRIKIKEKSACGITTLPMRVWLRVSRWTFEIADQFARNFHSLYRADGHPDALVISMIKQQ
jgi:hypothetical protein